MSVGSILKQRWVWAAGGLAAGLVIATVMPAPAQEGEPGDVGVRVAACGVEILSGQTNHCDGITVLRSEAGTPLSLQAAPGSPPLVVDSSTRIPDLNADRVDGYDAGDLLTKAGYDPDGDGMVNDSKRFSGRKPFFYMAKSTYDKNRNGIVDRAETVIPNSPLYIPAAAFSRDRWQDASYADWDTNGYWYTQGGDEWCVVGNVPLPDGVTLGSFVAHVFDNDTSGGFEIQMYRANLASMQGEMVAEVETAIPAASDSLQSLSTSLAGEVVDLSGDSYFVWACAKQTPDQNLRFFGVSVTFTTP